MKTLIPVLGFAPTKTGWRRRRVRPRARLITISSLPGCRWTRRPGLAGPANFKALEPGV